ncbi:DUF1127 domain-containing protein [Limimaricola pyoseonensis]|uniref:Uncharacterized conserved protein YjiS, DUF1127 family n=1 Tax=Limimaricola pyoseonensis TaxID=521013 RepID=A0A1G7CIP1_9RHOB|nr:DUF1127 domain-containing protein [Limimaricola pyoseonensis]SDE39228.1 Uncharacterized conserved protein YjiS, DUF1127 family [Limimaricola pyoseonensis]
MTSIATARPGAATLPLTALLTRLLVWHDTRRTAKALAALTDRELDDIGLDRSEIGRIARRSARR